MLPRCEQIGENTWNRNLRLADVTGPGSSCRLGPS